MNFFIDLMSFQIKGAGALSALAVVLSMGAGQAQAENKLFATDVLDAGKMDASVSLQSDRVKAAVLIPDVPYSMSSTARQTMASLSARYGIGAQTHVEAALVYGAQRGHSITDVDGERIDTRGSATGVVAGGLSVTHGLSLASVQPLTLAVGLGLKVFTDKNLAHKSYNTISAHAAAGWQFQNGFKAFSTLTWEAPEHADNRKSLDWGVGGWAPLSESIILVPEAGVRRVEGSDGVSARHYYTVGLGAHIQVAPRTYVQPSCRLDYAPSRDYTAYGLGVRDKSYVNQHVSVGLYQFF